MDLEQITKLMASPEKLIDARVIDELLFWTSAFIGDYEEKLAEVDQAVAVMYDDLATMHGSDAAGKRKLALTGIYKEQKETERRIRQLKAFRANLKRRYEILTNQFK